MKFNPVAEYMPGKNLVVTDALSRHPKPAYVKDIAKPARDFFAERGCLSQLNGVIRRGNQIVIPSSLRVEILERIHHGHMGLT